MTHRPSVLLIEDAVEMHTLIRAIFGSDVDLVSASSLAEGERALRARDFELVLLDGSLPDGDGFAFFARLRGEARFALLPVIFLTARGAINDRVAAFAMGAEDYVTKPIEIREFRARIDAKLRRLIREKPRMILEIGTLRVDRPGFRVYRIEATGPREVLLTPYEFKLLVALVDNEGTVLSRDKLINSAWGDAVNVLERTVDRHVSSLRKKLGAGPEKIQPVHGVGYRFVREEDPCRKVS